jgi:hypothetical protein
VITIGFGVAKASSGSRTPVEMLVRRFDSGGVSRMKSPWLIWLSFEIVV